MIEYILVPGYRLCSDGSPEPELTGRVDRAFDVWQQLRVPVICCGGDAAQTGITEAEVIKRLLLEKGMPEDSIIREDRSMITAENFANAALITGKGRRIALVTSDYHAARASLLARRAGFRVKCSRVRTPAGKTRRNRYILELLGIIDALCGWQTGKNRPPAVERFKHKVFAILSDTSSTKR